ncbi:MAG: hypothetical protein QG622_3070 [Actinomycetota bacterium]|nr:hypothetical protein [Actinomycetota bacterium]
MTHRTTGSSPAPARRTRRSATGLGVLILAGSLALAGCGGGGDAASTSGAGAAPGASSGSATDTKTTCDLSGCTVTFLHGVNTKKSVLGINVELVTVTADKVDLNIAGQPVSIPLTGQASTTIAGLVVTVQDANAQQVVLKITKA